MSSSPSSRKWRKSLFSFGINWPTKSSANPSPPISPLDSNCRQKRHNSVVTFAPSPPQSHHSNCQNIEEEKPQIQRQRGYSIQSYRSNHQITSSKFGHSHGSVQSLVNRQKIQQKSSISSTTTTMTSGGTSLYRRPSTPSLPLAIVQAVTGRIRKGSSTFSLDEGDSAFYSTDDSACSTASLSSSQGKRNSSELSSNVSEPSRQMPSFLAEWTEEDEEEWEKRFGNSLGHLMVKNYKTLAWSNLPMMKEEEPKVEESNILYAEGEVQFQLLSLVCPPGKRVVKVLPKNENLWNMSYAELMNRKLKSEMK